MNLGRLLTNAARRTPDAPAITQGDRTTSYRELAERVNALAHALRRLGATPGERVACLMPNSLELIETMFACFTAGVGWVPLNARFQAAEVAYHLADSGAVAIVTSTAMRDVVVGAEADNVHVVAVDDPTRAEPEWVGTSGYEAVLAAERDREPLEVSVDRDTLAWLFYTSGTTGRPKGAMLTHGILNFVATSWLADLTPMSSRDVTLHAAPLTHGAGFHALATTARGAHHVLAPAGRFEPAAIFDLMAEHEVTNTWLVPTQIVMLTDATGDRPVDLPNLKQIVYGGAPFPEPELRRALRAFGPRLVQLYGQGETPMTATVLTPDDHTAALAEPAPSRLATAGYARPGMSVRIVDETDNEVPAGVVGELVVSGPAVMTGYWNRPEETAQALRGGWLHTGDLGRLDEDGCLTLLDRVKDMIITGGSNVYAVEVESVLLDHPGVKDVAVIGIPDRTWGEQVVAVVVTDADDPVVKAQLEELCGTSLATYKHPRRYWFIDILPRNAYGKVLKRELRTMVADGRAG
ncbi:MAG TPA: AMP-binding protein [Mycobacteriales bacterium]|nr:AMP-binding protein [Mycobacteriales bacterium]